MLSVCNGFKLTKLFFEPEQFKIEIKFPFVMLRIGNLYKSSALSRLIINRADEKLLPIR